MTIRNIALLERVILNVEQKLEETKAMKVKAGEAFGYKIDKEIEALEKELERLWQGVA